MEERLQKILSRAGYGSRRACEELIARGRVAVNGQPAVLGMKADPEQDRITVNDQPVEVDDTLIYIAVNKPRNVISAASPQDNRKAVRELVDVPGHIYPVGRLDVDSEGLVLLTNDGKLTYRLTHPKFEHEKEYRVLVAARPDEKQLAAWRNGVVLEDGYRTQPARVRMTDTQSRGAWLQVVLTEGKKRQIREMGRLTGLPVVRIIRVRIGTLRLGNLKPREWRYLTPEEIAELKGKSQSKKPSGRQGSRRDSSRTSGKQRKKRR